MGCTSSQVPDPNVQYGRNAVVPQKQGLTQNGGIKQNGNKMPPKQNGHWVHGDTSFTTTVTNVSITSNGEALSNGENADKLNDTTASETTTLSIGRLLEPSRTLRGDLSQRQEARISRELRLKDMQKVREEKAMRISELVMEEKERLSLSTLSRSRATSRTGSPRLHRGDSMRPCTSTQIETTFSSPVPKSESEESLPEETPRPSALKPANGRRRKGEPKVRIITEDMDQSQAMKEGNGTTPTIQVKTMASDSNVDAVNNNNAQTDVKSVESTNKDSSNLL